MGAIWFEKEKEYTKDVHSYVKSFERPQDVFSINAVWYRLKLPIFRKRLRELYGICVCKENLKLFRNPYLMANCICDDDRYNVVLNVVKKRPVESWNAFIGGSYYSSQRIFESRKRKREIKYTDSSVTSL